MGQIKCKDYKYFLIFISHRKRFLLVFEEFFVIFSVAQFWRPWTLSRRCGFQNGNIMKKEWKQFTEKCSNNIRNIPPSHFFFFFFATDFWKSCSLHVMYNIFVPLYISYLSFYHKKIKVLIKLVLVYETILYNADLNNFSTNSIKFPLKFLLSFFVIACLSVNVTRKTLFHFKFN